MPVEIRELIIRASISSPDSSSAANNEHFQETSNELLQPEEINRQVSDLLKRQKER